MKDERLLITYPFNAYADMVKVKSDICNNVLDMPDEDIVDKMYEYGVVDDIGYQITCKKYKEYKTNIGISLECNIDLDRVIPIAEGTIRDMALNYSAAKASNFVRICRESDISILPISKDYIDSFERACFHTLGELRDTCGLYRELVFLDFASAKIVNTYLGSLPYGDVGTFFAIREIGDHTEGVVVKGGKNLAVVSEPTEKVHEFFRSVNYIVKDFFSKGALVESGGTVDVKVPLKEVAKPNKDALLGMVNGKLVEVEEKVEKEEDEIEVTGNSLLKEVITGKYIYGFEVLNKKKIKKVKQLTKYTREYMLGLKGIGVGFIQKLDWALEKASLSWKVDEEKKVKENTEEVKESVEEVTNIGVEEKVDSAMVSSLLERVISGENVVCSDSIVKDIFDLFMKKVESEGRVMDMFVLDTLKTQYNSVPLAVIREIELVNTKGFYNVFTDPIKTMCYKVYVREFTSMIDKGEKGTKRKELFEKICEILVKKGYFSMEEVYNFVEIIETPVSEDIAADIFRYVYTKDKSLAEDLVKYPVNKSKYYKDEEALHRVLSMDGRISVAMYDYVDEWCESRKVGYSFLEREIKSLKVAYDNYLSKYGSFEEVFKAMLDRFNGQYGLMSVVESSMPGYYKG